MAATIFIAPASLLIFGLFVLSRLPSGQLYYNIQLQIRPGNFSELNYHAFLVNSAAANTFNLTKSSAILDRRKNSVCLFTFNFLLLLSGDIQSNPGPQKHQCGLCSKLLRSNQRAIECEECSTWFHFNCLGLSAESFANFGLNSNLVWICSNCMFPNFSTFFF